MPDNSNPTWSGNVQVEYRSLRLLECCDKSSQALFTEIVRGSLVPIDWHVEWCDPEDGGEEEEEEAFFTEGGEWEGWVGLREILAFRSSVVQ